MGWRKFRLASFGYAALVTLCVVLEIRNNLVVISLIGLGFAIKIKSLDWLLG